MIPRIRLSSLRSSKRTESAKDSFCSPLDSGLTYLGSQEALQGPKEEADLSRKLSQEG